MLLFLFLCFSLLFCNPLRLQFESRKKKKDAKLSKEEFAQLKALEEKNGASKLNDD